MLSFLGRRLIVTVLVAIIVSMVSFLLLRLSGDLAQAIAGPSASAEDVRAIRHAQGLDEPLVWQYAVWVGHALRGDFGRSLFLQDSVAHLIEKHLPITILLGVLGMGLVLAIGMPLGIAAAVFPGSMIDRLALLVAVAGQAMPTFCLSLLLILVFAVQLQWLPASGLDGWPGLVLPSCALASYGLPSLVRLLRAGMLDILGADFLRTARAKGVGEAAVVLKHALRNAIIPVIALVAVQLGALFGGSIVVETIFALQGVGYLGWESITRADYPVVQAIVLILAVIYMLLTLGGDLLNAWLDPRIRLR